MAMLQYMQVIIPKLILDEKSHARTDSPQESTRITYGVYWQITNDISPFVILTNLISRWREECQQYLVFWMFLTQQFHQRTTLFKLAQRSSMKPYVLSLRIYLFLQFLDGTAFPLPHRLNLLAKKTGNGNTEQV